MRVKVLANAALVTGIFLVIGCQTGVRQVSSRPLHGAQKVGEKQYFRRGHDISEPQSTPQVYIRTEKTVIREVDDVNYSGSLMVLDHGANDLFSTHRQIKPGEYIDVKIVALGRTETGDSPSEAEEQQDEVQALQDELLEALPELAPSSEGEARLMASMKMQVIRVLENGDYRVRFWRESMANGLARSVEVEATLPHTVLASNQQATTRDLRHVDLREMGQGENIERHAAHWQDEYSLRISGFDEARSIAAQDLINKQRDLTAIRKKLEDRIKAFSQERSTFAKQRQELLEKSERLNQQLAKLNEEKLIDEQKAPGSSPLPDSSEGSEAQ